MLKIKEVIVVEGRYDKNTVGQAVNALIVETSGFGIYNDADKSKLLKKLAEKRGLIILTDNDSAGFLIRGHLKGLVEKNLVKHAYILDIKGREKRKRTPSKEGKLGVEGMDRDVIISALRRAGATFEEENGSIQSKDPVTKTDMYALGLSGTAGSAGRRLTLLRHLELPERLSANGLLDVLNVLYTRNAFYDLCRMLFSKIPEV